MYNQLYPEAFQSALAACREMKTRDPELLFFAGPILGSIAFKAYKAEWASNPQSPLNSTGRIFFSVWITDKSVQENKLLYNIHALKLRLFDKYRLTSRDFAAKFRAELKPHLPEWPNISLDYGPLTLMEGWKPLHPDTLTADIVQFTQNFDKISPLIDGLLQAHKKD